MTDVHVTIDGIILYCDESVTGINIGNGYVIKKLRLDEISFKNKVTNANGQLTINYLGSRMYALDGTLHLMCLHKEDLFQIQLPNFSESGCLTDDEIMCHAQLEAYKNAEMSYLNRAFSLLHLFKSGNIGPKEVFFEHRFIVMDFINNTYMQTSDNITRNIANTITFSLTPREVIECNLFLASISSPELTMLENSIHEFIWGLEQVDVPTGFEQYTTALEMTLLETDQQCKKEVLAKRTAALLETDDVRIADLYCKMKLFYRYRSESLHEGDGRNITAVELSELESIVRRVLKKYLNFCKTAIQNNPDIIWGEVKSSKISELRTSVVNLINRGVLTA